MTSGEAEQGSLLAETTPDTTPDTTPSVPRRCFVAHVACALSLALVLLLGFGEKAGMDMANLKEARHFIFFFRRYNGVYYSNIKSHSRTCIIHTYIHTHYVYIYVM
jgi:hypothetical protein